MAAYDNTYLGDLLKKVGGLMTQYNLSSGFMFDDNDTKVLSITTRDGPELTSLYYNHNLYYGEQTIVEVGVYYRYDSGDVTGRANCLFSCEFVIAFGLCCSLRAWATVAGGKVPAIADSALWASVKLHR